MVGIELTYEVGLLSIVTPSVSQNGILVESAPGEQQGCSDLSLLLQPFLENIYSCLSSIKGAREEWGELNL